MWAIDIDLCQAGWSKIDDAIVILLIDHHDDGRTKASRKNGAKNVYVRSSMGGPTGHLLNHGIGFAFITVRVLWIIL